MAIKIFKCNRCDNGSCELIIKMPDMEAVPDELVPEICPLWNQNDNFHCEASFYIVEQMNGERKGRLD